MPDKIEINESVGVLYWDPQKDITVYELSICLAALLANVTKGTHMAQRMIDAMPLEARRHWRIEIMDGK